MKYSQSSALLAALVPLASAFPAHVLEAVKSDPEIAARASDILGRQVGNAEGATAIFEAVPVFNADKQYISIDGDHKYVAPDFSKGDLRGPCPGLNAFANHGYLPHNGYATITQFIDATTNVVGMGPGLAAFLAVYGAAIDGDGLSWSIGGTPGAGIGGPLASQGNGISGSHNKYESDASPTRPDLYQTGNDYKIQIDQFKQLVASSADKKTITLTDLTNFRSARFDHQIASNPYFFNGPFTGVAVQPAAYTFIFRFMANHTAENPTGILSFDTLASWFGVTKDSTGSYVANPGQEKIPANWYRRSLVAPYDQAYFVADLANAAVLYPKFLNIGGNTNGVNTFTGVNVNDLTGGVMNTQNLANGNAAACLAYQFAANAKPDLSLVALTGLTNALSPLLSQLSCPQIKKFDDAQLMQFPGYKKSNV